MSLRQSSIQEWTAWFTSAHGGVLTHVPEKDADDYKVFRWNSGRGEQPIHYAVREVSPGLDLGPPHPSEADLHP